MSVLYENIVCRSRVLLQLVVRPAGFMGLVVPLGLIYLAAAVELVAPENVVAFDLGRLGLLGFLLGTRCKREQHRERQNRTDYLLALHSYLLK